MDLRGIAENWNVVSVGRIHRVKNLHFGLEALLNAPSSRPIKMTFIGPVEDEAYQKELVAMARNQDRVVVEFVGGMAPTELAPFWQKAHYFLSSTTQENFGHSIVEAWAHGCPVLISDRTPWRDLESKGSWMGLAVGSDGLAARFGHCAECGPYGMESAIREVSHIFQYGSPEPGR